MRHLLSSLAIICLIITTTAKSEENLFPGFYQGNNTTLSLAKDQTGVLKAYEGGRMVELLLKFKLMGEQRWQFKVLTDVQHAAVFASNYTKIPFQGGTLNLRSDQVLELRPFGLAKSTYQFVGHDSRASYGYALWKSAGLYNATNFEIKGKWGPYIFDEDGRGFIDVHGEKLAFNWQWNDNQVEVFFPPLLHKSVITFVPMTDDGLVPFFRYNDMRRRWNRDPYQLLVREPMPSTDQEIKALKEAAETRLAQFPFKADLINSWADYMGLVKSLGERNDGQLRLIQLRIPSKWADSDQRINVWFNTYVADEGARRVEIFVLAKDGEATGTLNERLHSARKVLKVAAIQNGGTDHTALMTLNTEFLANGEEFTPLARVDFSSHDSWEKFWRTSLETLGVQVTKINGLLCERAGIQLPVVDEVIFASEWPKREEFYGWLYENYALRSGISQWSKVDRKVVKKGRGYQIEALKVIDGRWCDLVTEEPVNGFVFGRASKQVCASLVPSFQTIDLPHDVKGDEYQVVCTLYAGQVTQFYIGMRNVILYEGLLSDQAYSSYIKIRNQQGVLLKHLNYVNGELHGGCFEAGVTKYYKHGKEEK